MRAAISRRFFAVAATVTAGVAASVVVALGQPIHGADAAAATIPTDDRAIVHVLNRIGFGPRPGDVERVRRLGLHAYIDQQLHPERIADATVAARLAELPTLTMSSRELAEKYLTPQLRAMSDRQRQAARDGEAGDGGRRRPGPQPDSVGAPESEMLRRGNSVVGELSQAKLLRAVYSERQLQEVLADFWFNHFNVDARKGPVRVLLTEYEREAIRPHVLGTFRDLLEATAKSPAMLFYLDNWMSADTSFNPGAPAPRRGFAGTPRAPFRSVMPNARIARGLNENYGRELMELHTIGVDAGYTQKDVTEVARAFTGWTIEQPRLGGSFRFEPRMHDRGEKIVLGHRIRAGGGIEDGEQVLDILAKHPATATFIAIKLARRFVSDDPPAPLVDRAAARFRDTGGDLREVVRAIITSPEFLAPEAYRAKTKTPLEFVASAVRAAGADVQSALPLVRTLQQLGMPLYLYQPPTGYKDTAEAWVNSGALIGRMNFAVALSSNRFPGLGITNAIGPTTDGSTADDLAAARMALVRNVLGDDVSESTLVTISKATSVQQMAALTLGSPEFQKR